MDKTTNTASKTNQSLKLLLKLTVTIICIWYVSGKIDFAKAGDALGNADWSYLLLGLFTYIISKIISAARLNIYFKNISIILTKWDNIKLYWLGMFYNLFLPGSISGDAYKVILLSKRFGIAYKKTTAAVLLDRFSGLLGLGLILAAYSFFVLNKTLHIILLAAGSIVSIIAFYFIIKRFFKDFIPGFLSTLILGMLVQAIQVLCIYMIMLALHIPTHQYPDYIFLFLVSSVVSVLPLTIGGLGIREVVFLEGSLYFGLVQETSVIISILFYLITLLTSAWGVYYVFRSPLNEKGPSDEPLIS